MPLGAVVQFCATCGQQVWPVWWRDRQDWYTPIYCDGICAGTCDDITPPIKKDLPTPSPKDTPCF